MSAYKQEQRKRAEARAKTAANVCAKAAQAFENEAADFLGAGAAARLAGQHHVMAARAQRVGQHPCLGGLARPVDPFEADEPRGRGGLGCQNAPSGPSFSLRSRTVEAVVTRETKPPRSMLRSATSGTRVSGKPSGVRISSASC